MKKIETNLNDCYILEPTQFGDARGYYSPVYIDSELAELGFQGIKQVSRSKSSKGILRGMHFQRGDFAQAKIVEVMYGSVIDVVVDMRPESPSYRQWTSLCLHQIITANSTFHAVLLMVFEFRRRYNLSVFC